MKRLIQTLVLILAMVSIPAMVNAKKKATKEVTYKVALDCHKCLDKVMKNIPYEKGVKDVKASIEKQEVTVMFVEDKNTIENLKIAIDKLDSDFNVEVKTSACCEKDAKSACCKKR